jgi:large subunit ribosomal protein L17
MRHLKTGRKLSRNSAHRRAMFRNMVTSLILNGRVTTTDAKAKELRRYADRMITLGKRQTLAARRRASRFVRTDAAVAKLFGQLAPLFAQRAGGYTRVIKVARRRGDAAPLSVVELTEQAPEPARDADKTKAGRAGKTKETSAKEGKAKEPKAKQAKSKEPKTREKKAKASKKK